MSTWISVLFALSGCAGLIFEVVWSRQLSLLFGSTVQSASITAGTFLLALGVGAYFGGRLSRSKNLLLTYALLELTVGLIGILVTWLLPQAFPLASLLSGQNQLSLVVIRCLGAAFFIGLPCLAMGASLPVLCSFLADRKGKTFLTSLSRLYAVNTLGAVTGVVLTDWVLVQRFGIFSTGCIAGAIDILVAGLALYGARHSDLSQTGLTQSPAGDTSIVGSPDSDTGPSISFPWHHLARPLLVVTGLGFCGTMMQVVWTRCLIVFHGSDLVAFSSCLATYLSGLALGGGLAGLLPKKWQSHSLTLPLVLLAAGSCVTLSLLELSWLERGANFWLDNIAIIGPGATALGMAFPLATTAAQQHLTNVADVTGASLLSNTLGSMFGAMLTGFIILPMLGLQWTFAIATFVLLMLSGIAATTSSSRVAITLVTTSIVLTYSTVSPLYLRHLIYPNPAMRFLFWGEDSYGTVALVTEPNEFEGDTLALMVDSFNMMGNVLPARRYATAISALPIFWQQQPDDVLVICFGMAHTLNTALSVESTRRVECAELSPTVIKALSGIEQGQRALSHPKLALNITDGRHHLLTTKHAYNVIVAEPPPPTHAGVVSLYTREYFQLCRDRLKPGGMSVQWLPIFQMSQTDCKSIIRAFTDVFPNSYLAEGSFRNLLLIGTLDPLTIDYSLLEKRANQIDPTLQANGWEHPEFLATSIVAGPKALKTYCLNSPPLTDDWPVLQYSKPNDNYNPDYGSLVLNQYPREHELKLSDQPQVRQRQLTALTKGLRAQRALRFYLYRDLASLGQPAAYPGVSALESYSQARLAFQLYPKTQYFELIALTLDKLTERLRQRCLSGVNPAEAYQNLARIHYLTGDDVQAIDEAGHAQKLAPHAFKQAFEILVMWDAGHNKEAKQLLELTADQLQPLDRAFLKKHFQVSTENEPEIDEYFR
jgi:spermidine synthase